MKFLEQLSDSIGIYGVYNHETADKQHTFDTGNSCFGKCVAKTRSFSRSQGRRRAGNLLFALIAFAGKDTDAERSQIMWHQKVDCIGSIA